MPKRDWTVSQNRNPKSILVLRLRYLGDIVRMTPVLRNLRAAYPNAHIGFLCDENYANVLETNTDFDELLPMPKKRDSESQLAYLFRYITFLLSLRKAGWEVAYDYQMSSRTHLLWKLVGIPEVRFDGIYMWRKKYWPANYHISKKLTDSEAHVGDRYLSFLEAYGIPCPFRGLVWNIRAEDHQGAAKWIAAAKAGSEDPVVIIHPGSRVLPRQWPAERFAELITGLASFSRLRFIIIGGPTEQAQVRRIKELTNVELIVIDEVLSLPVMAAILAEMALFIGHDSGPMHVASAVGTPIVALCGSQAISQWCPREVPHVMLQAPLPCGEQCVSPDKCVVNDSYNNYCVRRLTVDYVFESTCKLLIQIEQTEGGSSQSHE